MTLLAIAVPEQLATARLAGMPPVTGLYAFAAGSVLFALLGSNPQLSVGADSTIAPLFAGGIGSLAVAGTSRYAALVTIMALLTGLILIAVWLLRLAWISDLLSAPIIDGFLAGVGVVIIVHQLPALLGLGSGGGGTLHRLGVLVGQAGATRAWPLAIGLGVLATIELCERLDHRLPGAFLALVGSTAVVAAAGLGAHGVPVLGGVARAAPHLGLAGVGVQTVGRLLPGAAVIALVVVTQTAATTRAFAEEGEYEVDVGRDLLGVGAGSVAAGLLGAFPVDASPPRTAAIAASGGRTQLASLAAAAAVLGLVPALGLLSDLPLATLAGILLFVASRLFHLHDLRAIARFDRFEFALALVTLLAVALVGVEQGIGVAVALAILDRARLSARPQLHVLGRIPGTTSWAPLDTGEGAEQMPGTLVLLFATPLWYANATHFRAQFHAALEHAQPQGRPLAVVLDTVGMTDIDYTGSRALRRVLDELDRAGVAFAVARAGERARLSLARSGLGRRIGEDWFFPAVDEAVSALAAKYGSARVAPTDLATPRRA